MLHVNGTEQQTAARPAAATSTNAQRVALYLLGKLALGGFLDTELAERDSFHYAWELLADGLQETAGHSALIELVAGVE